MKTCCDDTTLPSSDDNEIHLKLALIGNPNSGKTTLFNKLTGARQKTGNWPGVTVERKTGEFSISGNRYKVVDLPGTYALDTEDTSLDERVARGYVVHNRQDLFINVVDITTLERGLNLTLQLREQGVPLIVLLSMRDIGENSGLGISTDLLSEELGCPVISADLKKDNLFQLLEPAIQSATKRATEVLSIEYPEIVEKTLNKIEQQQAITRREALQYLQEIARDENNIDPDIADIEQQTGKTLHYILAKSHFTSARILAEKITHQSSQSINAISDKIDKWALGNFTGIPIFLLMIYLLFFFSINLGGAFIDFFDLSTQAIFVDGLSHLMDSMGSPTWLTIIIASGIGGGIQVVATFIPIIGALYLFLTALEESGYMSRAAFVMDRFMNKIGISGKAFVPLIVGFGCNVPAIMATRTMDSHRERIMAVMMTPFMSCGARLTVYALFAAIFFPVGGQNIVFLLYLTGIGFAVLTALILRNTLLKGEAEDFIMEMPTYQLPGMRNLFINTWNKLKGFVTGAGKVIVVVVMIINVVNSIGTDGSFGNEDTDKSVLSATARVITPVFGPMGIKEDNWPATVGILTGVLAKEVVVGTLDALYSNIDKLPSEQQQQQTFVLSESLMKALETIPKNVSDALSNMTDPLGIAALDQAESLQQAAEQQQVDSATFAAMKKRFDGKIGAFAYMLFILLYFPCVAATGAMYRETGKNWAILGVLWSTGLAYGSAVIFYQLATFMQHPLQSLIWTATLLMSFILAVWIMFKTGKNKNHIPVFVNFS
jgi:ferrous iron transport protein B